MKSNISCISGRGRPVRMADVYFFLKICINIILYSKVLIKTVFKIIQTYNKGQIYQQVTSPQTLFRR